MLTQIVIFMLLSTGSVLGATIVKKRYEEFLPITCSAIVLILFLFGICGNLNAGVYFLCILSVVLYLLSIYIIWEKKCLKEALKNIFTGAFVIFAILFCTLSFLDKGKLMVEWDEFSHWGDIVKVMVTLDDFGTNPDSHSICQAYPPGMSLFQYFVQKIYSICSGKNNFNEWRLYFAYQIFALSFFFPFLKKLNNKNMFGIVSSGFLIFVSPLLFYHDFYSSIYIDPFLGILEGMGLVMIFVH